MNYKKELLDLLKLAHECRILQNVYFNSLSTVARRNAKEAESRLDRKIRDLISIEIGELAVGIHLGDAP